jgi:acetyltransferase
MEATRIGYPVKLSVASPDLRIWDHADLVVPNAANAAAVREAFRVLMTMATERDPAARLLGVHVTADAAASALLHIDVRPAQGDWSIASIGRDATSEHTLLALPTTNERLRRALQRARISTLADRPSLDALADVLNRICAFVVDHRDAVQSVRIDPLAVLVGGGTECREMAVAIGDVFERSLGR